MAIFSLILSLIGLISVAISFVSYGFGAPIGIVVSIVSLVVSLIKRQDDLRNKRLYNYAIACSIVAICVGVVLFSIFINSLSSTIITYIKNLLS